MGIQSPLILIQFELGRIVCGSPNIAVTLQWKDRSDYFARIVSYVCNLFMKFITGTCNNEDEFITKEYLQTHKNITTIYK